MSSPQELNTSLKQELVWNYGYWGEHPDYPHSDWKYEVDNGDTREGYWEWVARRINGD